jgi:HK97 family phage major capsid protein
MATPTAVPRNQDELAEMFSDGKFLKRFENQDDLKTFIAEYGEKQQGNGTDLNRMIAEETQRVFAEMLKDNGFENATKSKAGDAIRRLNLDPQSRGAGMLTSHKQATAHNPEAAGAVLDGVFDNAVDFARTTWFKNNAPDPDKFGALRNAASSTSPADGGFLVPETLRSQLAQIALEDSVIRPRATVVPMDSARVPMPMIDSTTNQGSVFGGMIAYWGEESAMLVDSSPKFGRVVLDAKKLTGLSAVPNELLQDSITSFSALLESLWPKAIAFSEDAAFQTGTGVGEPKGYRGSANKAAIAVTRNTSSTIKYLDVVAMYAQMLPSSLSRAVWICSPDAIPQLLQMSLTVGTGGNSMFVVNATDSMPMSIFGRPLIITEKAAPLGTRGDLSFVDLSYYLIGDRQSWAMDNSADYRFGNDQTTYRIIQRVDGQPWLKSAITPQNGSSNKLSPFIELN